MIDRLLKAALIPCLSSMLVAQQTATPPLQSQGSAPAASSSPTPVTPHTLMDGTPVKLRLAQTISSADSKVGQEVPFEVVEEVKADDVIVLAKGATAIATVTEAEPKRRMARGGKLNVNINYARLVDQEKIALRAVKESKGGGHVGAMTGAIVATSIVFFPAAPFFLFMHGKDVTIPQGTEITAFIDGDMHLDMARFGARPNTTAAEPAGAQAGLAIDSDPPGADIEVDGAFVGSTPSTLSMAPGTHEIVVKKKGFSTWTRKMNVTGGTVHVSAELEAAAGSTP